MNISQSLTSARAGVFAAVMGSFPTGLKRATMLSSLIAGLTNHQPEKQFVCDLDDALCLSRGGGAGLEFPVLLTKVFWGNLEIHRNDVAVLKDVKHALSDRMRAALNILDHVPSYFVYAGYAEMADDLIRYFDYTAKSATPA
jgi:hypothetical protein